MDKIYNTMFNYDKEHEQYRQAAFMRILHTMQQKFMNTIRFEGDENFTIAMQRALFKSIFRRGVGGVFNYKKYLSSRISDKLEKINVDYIHFTESIVNKIVKNDRKILEVTGTYFDDSERIVRGTGITLPRANLGNKSYPITNEDTAIFQYSTDYMSGYILWLPIAYMIATAETVAKKRVTLMDEKMASNNGNSHMRSNQFDDIYDVGASFITLQPSTSTFGADDEVMRIKLGEMLKTKVAKLNLSGGETLTDLLEYMKEYKSYVDHLMGIRSNTNKKGERNISSEFTSEEIHWAIMENDIKEQAQMFADDYKKIYGKELTIIHMSDEVLREQEAQEIAVANGGKGNDDNNNTENI